MQRPGSATDACVRDSFARGRFGVHRYGRKTVDQHRVPFETHIDLLWLLDHLIRERAPFGVGGMSPGQSDDVALLTASDELSGPFIELSWSAPQHWILREIVGRAQEWATESDTGKIASSAFDL